MEIIIIFLVLIILGLIYFMFKFNKKGNNKEEKVVTNTEELSKQVLGIKNDFDSFKNNIEEGMKNFFIGFSDSINKNFRETQTENSKILMDFSNRITAFSEGNKFHKESIDELGMKVTGLAGILDNKQLRGMFGEANLYQILENVLGKNDELFKRQHKLSNGTIVDAIVFSPEPLGAIAIDSKFPMENYNRMLDSGLTEQERVSYEKLFKKDLKTHVNDISNKYLIKKETANYAIMFIPAESIFLEVHNNHNDLINYAQDKNVILSSPSTLLVILSTIQSAVLNIKRSENLDFIEKSLLSLSDDFYRFAERWEKISRTSKTLVNQINEFDISVNKIGRTFEKINNQEK